MTTNEPTQQHTLIIEGAGDLTARFFPLFQEGVFLRVITGVSVQDLLFRQLHLLPEYVEKRIQTIFLNGKAVDDLTEPILLDGAVLAMSAAMPGLAGATLRRGGFFASLRRSITFSGDHRAPAPRPGRIRLKLFNLLLSELVPELLDQGFEVHGRDLNRFLDRQPEDFWQACRSLIKDDRLIRPPYASADLHFPDEVFVQVRVTHPSPGKST